MNLGMRQHPFHRLVLERQVLDLPHRIGVLQIRALHRSRSPLNIGIAPFAIALLVSFAGVAADLRSLESTEERTQREQIVGEIARGVNTRAGAP